MSHMIVGTVSDKIHGKFFIFDKFFKSVSGGFK